MSHCRSDLILMSKFELFTIIRLVLQIPACIDYLIGS
jgi:hypothetical protein